MNYYVQKAANYLMWAGDLQDKHGFIHSDKCDSLLFTSLAGAAGMPVNIWSAYKDDRWYRRPTDLDPCCPNSSKSSISRDMLLGLLIYAYATGNQNVTESIIKQMNQGVMGDYVGIDGLSRVIPSPGLYATAKILLRAQRGKSAGMWQFVPPTGSVPLPGFQGHLQALHIALRCLLLGKITQSTKAILLDLWMSDQRNPLFAILGPHSTSVGMYILADERLFPSDRLPYNTDRAPPWLPERNSIGYGSSSMEPEKHTGMDYNFCLWMYYKWESLKDT